MPSWNISSILINVWIIHVYGEPRLYAIGPRSHTIFVHILAHYGHKILLETNLKVCHFYNFPMNRLLNDYSMSINVHVHIHVVITGQQINKHLNLHDVLAIYKSNWIPVALSNPLLLACKQYALLLFSLDDVRLGRDIFRWTNIFNVCKKHWPQCILVKLCQGFVITIYCTVPLLHGNQSAQNRWCQFHNITMTDLHKYNIIWQQILHLCLLNWQNIVIRRRWGTQIWHLIHVKKRYWMHLFWILKQQNI